MDAGSLEARPKRLVRVTKIASPEIQVQLGFGAAAKQPTGRQRQSGRQQKQQKNQYAHESPGREMTAAQHAATGLTRH